MSINPDLIRVDILRLRRKMYLELPEGSKEREAFVFAFKISELGYLSKLVPQDLATKIFDEYKSIIRSKLISFLVSLGIGISLSMMFYGFSLLDSKSVWANLWYMPVIVCGIFSFRYIFHILDEYRALEPFRTEYSQVQAKIQKLKKEIDQMKDKK